MESETNEKSDNCQPLQKELHLIMRYIITTFQGLGIALVATATLRLPDVSGVGTLIGLWLIVFGFVLHMLIGGDKK